MSYRSLRISHTLKNRQGDWSHCLQMKYYEKTLPCLWICDNRSGFIQVLVDDSFGVGAINSDEGNDIVACVCVEDQAWHWVHRYSIRSGTFKIQYRSKFALLVSVNACETWYDLSKKTGSSFFYNIIHVSYFIIAKKLPSAITHNKSQLWK